MLVPCPPSSCIHSRCHHFRLCVLFHHPTACLFRQKTRLVSFVPTQQKRQRYKKTSRVFCRAFKQGGFTHRSSRGQVRMLQQLHALSRAAQRPRTVSAAAWSAAAAVSAAAWSAQLARPSPRCLVQAQRVRSQPHVPHACVRWSF